MPKEVRIKREMPPAGTELRGKFKGKKYKAVVVTDDKNTSLRLIRFNDVNYKTMTAAAKAITKQETNGWRFWKYKSKQQS